jgi:hypothetical protein
MMEKTRKESRIAGLVLAFMAMVVMFVMFGPTAQKAWADGELEPVEYVDAEGKTHTVTDYVEITSQNVVTEWETGWYFVNEKMTIEDYVNVSGDVNLILGDGKTVTANKGVYVPVGASLTIWGQTKESGELDAFGGFNEPGIGGGYGNNKDPNCGTIIVNSGGIIAKSKGIAAGIGGAYYGNGGNVTINGGAVVAEQKTRGGAAIGGGENGDAGTFIMNGGYVVASARGDSAANSGAAGIGAGASGKAGVIQINGGILLAYGGIGYPGIGSKDNTGAEIVITGGDIYACGGDHSAGIGSGSGGAGGVITITGGQIYAEGDDRQDIWYYDVEAPGIGAGDGGADATITLGWTNLDDYIESSYGGTVILTKEFSLEDEYGELATSENIDGVIIVPRTYEVCLDSSDGGSLECDDERAAKGQEVTVMVSPEKSYDLVTLQCLYYDPVKDSDAPVELTKKDESTYTFKMPGYPVTVIAGFGRSTDYVDAQGNSHTVSNYQVLDSDLSDWEDEWLVLTEDTTINDRIYSYGEVNLILCDGATLKAPKGITVDKYSTLIIWAQAEGSGKLIATGDDYCAGIGDGFSNDAGTIIINGGRINATGGLYSDGIGGYLTKVIINGGSVVATSGGEGSGIGGVASKVTVNGGKLTVEAGDHGFGIGGYASKFTINGGQVLAMDRIFVENGSISIRGGKVGAQNGICGEESTITIDGGSVQAASPQNGTAIGGKDCKVAINGGSIFAFPSYPATDYAIGCEDCEVTLGWTLDTDYITCGGRLGGDVRFAKDRKFVDDQGKDITAEAFVERCLGGRNVRIQAPSGEYYGIELVSGEGSLQADCAVALAGQTVTVTERHSYPYVLDGVLATTESGASVGLANTGAHIYEFTMPAEKVILQANYHVTNESVHYVDANGEKHVVSDPILLNSSNVEEYLQDGKLQSGWYAICGDITVDGAIIIKSNVNLLLCDGAKLEVNEGIEVDEGAVLTIWGQEEGSGVLIAEGKPEAAGIGGADDYQPAHFGEIVINGGTIQAKGGFNAAGIGSGLDGERGSITINGGTILAEGRVCGAGIGGGLYGTADSVTINGGTVTAIGGNRGAGIGTGIFGHGGYINIHGGTVTAKGRGGSAGIGSGYDASCADINVLGGQVTAVGEGYYDEDADEEIQGPGIGSGVEGKRGHIYLGYTNADDFIEATYDGNETNFSLIGQFELAETGEKISGISDANGKRIVPAKYKILAYSRASGESTASVADVMVAPSAKVFPGESVKVTAPDKSALGYSFLGWHEVTELTAEGNEVISYDDEVLCDKLSYTFTASDEDMAVVAVYEARGNAQVTVSAVNGAKYFVNNGPTAQGGSTENVQLGTTLLLTAGDADKVLCWMNESNKVLGTKASLRLVVTGDTAVTLVYRPEATNSAFVQFENDFGQVLGYKSYSQGDVKVDYPGMPSKFGFTFEKWVFKGTNEEASQEAILARVANGGVITVVPKYVQDDRKYVVTVRYQDAEGAEIRTEDEFPEILVGTGYTVTAPAVDGYAFSCWKDSNGTILGYNESYYFLVASDNSLTAVYAADGSAQQTQAQPVITIGMPSAVTTTDAHKVSCTVTRSIPDGYELQEHGILYAKGVEGLNETTFVYGTAGVSKYMSDKTSTSGVVKLNVKVSGDTISSGDNMNISFRGYMILKDNATGNVATYYTDIASGSYAALNTQN